jgi:hypothetical protein
MPQKTSVASQKPSKAHFICFGFEQEFQYVIVSTGRMAESQLLQTAMTWTGRNVR